MGYETELIVARKNSNAGGAQRYKIPNHEAIKVGKNCAALRGRIVMMGMSSVSFIEDVGGGPRIEPIPVEKISEGITRNRWSCE